MYRPHLKPRDRLASLALVGAIHAGLILAMLNLSGAIDIVSRDDLTQLIDIADPVPPPVEEQPVELEAAPEEEGEASPPNVVSKATPVVDPKPRVPLPLPVPVPVSPTPNQGTETTQGAAPVPGPGTGAGGVGTGTGAGGSGSGTGGGGDGGIAARAQLLSGGLRSRDYPPEYRRLLARGAAPFVMFTVQPNGRVTNCRIYQTSGDPGLDDFTCRLVTARFVYRPAYDRRGEPVPSDNAYRQAF